MKIKYRDNTLKPNKSQWCMDCAIYEYVKKVDGGCFGLCYKTHVPGGFNITDDCKVLEL